MDHSNIKTESFKNKHLNFSERMTIEIHFKDGIKNYKFWYLFFYDEFLMHTKVSKVGFIKGVIFTEIFGCFKI